MKYEEELEKEGIADYIERYLKKCIAPNFAGDLGFKHHDGGYYPFYHAPEWIDFVILTPYKTRFLKRAKVRSRIAVRLNMCRGGHDIYVFLYDRRLSEYILHLKKLLKENFTMCDVFLERGFPKAKREMSCHKKKELKT